MMPLGTVTKKSHAYETPPWGVESQPRFLNACVLLETGLEAGELLRRVKGIEDALGRVERGRWGPREIDVDILTFGGGAMESLELTVPHPRMRERAFVLVPLNEIAPDMMIPPGCEPVADLLKKTDARGIVRIAPL
jgi:2-amino-4-hydroxy-6-hydroxymethyldihydropteridine diphosphokinase